MFYHFLSQRVIVSFSRKAKLHGATIANLSAERQTGLRPTLTVLSVLSLFIVSLFILCLNAWLCLCLCWPCAPLVLPPYFQLPRPLV